jgi:hypothetical protein
MFAEAIRVVTEIKAVAETTAVVEIKFVAAVKKLAILIVVMAPVHLLSTQSNG